MTPEDETNHPYDLLWQYAKPVVILVLGMGIGACLVLIYLSRSIY
jgi:type II secretory pathway component PulF